MCKLISAQTSTLVRSHRGVLYADISTMHWFERDYVPDISENPVWCVYDLTYQSSSTNTMDMAASSQKKKALLASGTLNPHPEAVQSALFADGDFFDPRDKAQVKYEMLRVHRVEGVTVTEACRQFGFSRESFYQVREAFQSQGFQSFLPAKRGRKGPSKLKGEALEFALAKKQEEPQIDPGQLAGLIAQRYGIEVHRTTVQRALKKKPRASAERRPQSRSGQRR
jgi:transposase